MRSGAKTPLKLAVFWLATTYLGFLLLGQVDQVTNPWQLAAAVFAFGGALVIGYLLQLRTHPWPSESSQVAGEPSIRSIKLLVLVGALHYLAFGLIYLREYGLASPGAITSALLDPGSAYLAKFAVYMRQEALGGSNPGTQFLTLTAAASAPLVPLLVIYWRKLTTDLRILALVGLASYMSFFLAIGTLAGLGSSVIFAGVGLMVMQARRRQGGKARRRRGASVFGLLLVLLFVSYMSYNQGARLIQTGLNTDQRFSPNSLVEKLTNRSFAQGMAVTAFYPTHGYQGLAYNLETPFEWTSGLGASRALDGYVAQYGLAESQSSRTYPARTEKRTGWPSGVYWATIYPWLASDLSWFGVPLFMALLGWWTSRWWREAVLHGDVLSLLLFAQAMLCIAFIPANNQIGVSRPYLITVTVLLVLYALREVRHALVRSGRVDRDLTYSEDR